MKRGDVWWVAFDHAADGEIKKTRPAIVVSNDSINRHSNRLQVVPCTSNTSKVYPSEAVVGIRGKSSKALADQITTAGRARFKSYITTLMPHEMSGVDKAMRWQLQLPHD